MQLRCSDKHNIWKGGEDLPRSGKLGWLGTSDKTKEHFDEGDWREQQPKGIDISLDRCRDGHAGERPT